MRRVTAATILALGALLAIPQAQAEFSARTVEVRGTVNGVPHDTGQLQNGDFSSGRMFPWVLRPRPAQMIVTKGGRPPMPSLTEAFVNGDGQLQVNFGPDGPGSSTQILQKDLHLEGDTTYVLRFDAKSSFGGNVRVRVIQHVEPFESYGIKVNRNIQRLMKTHELIFTTPPGDKFDARLSFYFPGLASPGEIYCFDNISLEKLEECGDGNVTGDESCDSGAGPVVEDGGLETGPLGDVWAETSTVFGQVIYGDFPAEGSAHAWFGGGADEVATLSQTISLPDAAVAELRFLMWLITCSGSEADVLEVTIDGNVVFLADGTDPECGAPGYKPFVVDLSPYLGQTVELRFSGFFGPDGGDSNFFVDAISIDVNGCRADCTFCGDGVTNSHETCDDGNYDDFDGCSTTCMLDDQPYYETPRASEEQPQR